MITGVNDSIDFENDRMRGLISKYFRNRITSYLSSISVDQLHSHRENGCGRVVTLKAGQKTVDAVVVGDKSMLRWYFLKALNCPGPAPLPPITKKWCEKYAASAEKHLLSGSPLQPCELFSNAAFSAFMSFRPRTALNAYDFCRILGLTSYTLILRDKVSCPVLTGRSILFNNPEMAFRAAGAMVETILSHPGLSWQLVTDSEGAYISDDRSPLYAGAITRQTEIRRQLCKSAYSLLSAVVASAGCSAAEMGIFIK